MVKYLIRYLTDIDYYSYTNLLKQLTTVGDISWKQFRNFLYDLDHEYTNTHIFVMEDHDQYDHKNDRSKIIAAGTIIIEQKLIHNCGKVGHIEDVVVDEKYRGQYLGKQIVEYLVEFGKKEGCYKVILDCDEKYKEFYEKTGFEKKNIQMALYF